MIDNRVLRRALCAAGFVGAQSLSLSAATPIGAPYFGNPDFDWGRRSPITDEDRNVIANIRRSQSVLTVNFASTQNLAADWVVKTDNRTDLKSCRAPESVVSADAGLELLTLQSRNCYAKFSTGSIWSKYRQRYGYFEARIKIAGISGVNNAFWLTTTDGFEIDIAEVHYPNIVFMTLHNNNISFKIPHSVGFKQTFSDNFSLKMHTYGALWTPTRIVFTVDGEPIAALDTHGAITGTADIRFSTALGDFGRLPDNPVGSYMLVDSLAVKRFADGPK
jgi:hypothetical protein